MKNFYIGEMLVRTLSEHGYNYICLSDLEKVEAHHQAVKGWMSNDKTIGFLETCEEFYESAFQWQAWGLLKIKSPAGYLRMSPSKWSALGGNSFIVKRGRNGGIFAETRVATHFANWLSPKIYLATINAVIDVVDEKAYLDWLIAKIENNEQENSILLGNLRAQLNVPDQSEFGQVKRKLEQAERVKKQLEEDLGEDAGTMDMD